MANKKNQKKQSQKELARMKRRARKQAMSIIVPIIALVLVIGGIIALGIPLGWYKDKPDDLYHAEIEIENYGTIHLELYRKQAPETVDNFMKLAKEGFYDGLTFHRIIEGFMMQGGDPNGDGTGGSKQNIKGEFSANGFENNISHERGVISMARKGGNTSTAYNSATSQFFIMHKDNTKLDGQYAAFGRVIDGLEIVDQICESASPTDNNGTIPDYAQPVITSITIHAAH